MKLLKLIIMLLLSTDIYAQLLYLEVADSSRYIDQDKELIVYPKYNLRKSKDQSLFFKGKLLFNNSVVPEGYSNILYEIYQASYLLITFYESSYNGISDPFHIPRKHINIINLNKLDTVYKVKFDGINILSNKKYLSKFKDLNNVKVYALITINSNELILKDSNGNELRVPLKAEKNPFVD